MKMKSVLCLPVILFCLLLCLAIAGTAQVGPIASVQVYSSTSDLCQNPSVAKSSVAVNISTATTTELVAAVASKHVWLCKLNVTVAGTSPTIVFKTGTKVSTACDTSPTSLSGTYAITSGSTFDVSATSGTPFESISGGEMCLTSGGTTPSIQGVAVYVQR